MFLKPFHRVDLIKLPLGYHCIKRLLIAPEFRTPMVQLAQIFRYFVDIVPGADPALGYYSVL